MNSKLSQSFNPRRSRKFEARTGKLSRSRPQIEHLENRQLLSTMIVDDYEPGFRIVGKWPYARSTDAYDGDLVTHSAGTGANTATWTFEGLTPGRYEVAASWGLLAASNASNSPFTTRNGATPISTVQLNQRIAPNDFQASGAWWERLGTFTITGTTLSVTLTDNANGRVMADAIRIASADTSTPEPLKISAGGPYQGNEGSPINLASAGSGGVGTLTYAWDLNNDGTFETSGRSVTPTYTDNRVQTIRARVTDSQGATAIATTTVTVYNVNPTPNAGGPYHVTAGELLTVSGSATDPGLEDTNAGLSYVWSFGDGTPNVSGTNLRTPSHSYATAGSYTISLRVTDKDGGSSTSTAVATIDPAAPAPPHGGTIHTGHDNIPNFGENPTIVSIVSGAWSNPATWSVNRVPGAGDIVGIDAGTVVDYDIVSTVAIDTVSVEPGARLRFRTNLNTKLTVVNLLVHEGGTLEVGTVANPIPANLTAEIVVADQAIDTTMDPEQYGHGLIALGKVTMHGAIKSSTFVRLAAEPRAGQTTLTLTQAVTGWRPGDRLILPDSKQWAMQTVEYVPEYEEATIGSVSADGRTLTLTAPLQFNHPGAQNGDGVLEYLPHVGNLTRNVTIRSENAAGTRGYTFFTHRADVDIRYAGFVALGRTTIDPLDNTTFDSNGVATHIGTNQIGRYPVHLHHLMGPENTPANGQQYTFVGNAVFCRMPDNEFKWGVAIHDSHYGLIKDNVLYNWAGAGMVTEDGNESFNVIERNFVVRGIGTGSRDSGGTEGAAFWFRGPNNYLRDNVAANYRGNSIEVPTGYKMYFPYLDNVRIPNFKGADTAVTGQYTVWNGNAMPLLEFARNEVYGMEVGMSLWWLNTIWHTPQNGGTSVVKDFLGWNLATYGFYGYSMADVTFDGYIIRGNKQVLANRHENPIGMWFGDYFAKNTIVRHADIQGMRTGFIDPYHSGWPTIIEDSFMRNSTNIEVHTPGAPGDSSDGKNRGPKSLTIRNVKFGSIDGWNLGGRTPYDIAMYYSDQQGSANLIVSDTVTVYDYNGVAGDNFQLYYNEQRADFVVPQSSGNLVGSPDAGRTNQQNWERYGIAIAGAVAPGTATTRARIGGLVRRF